MNRQQHLDWCKKRALGYVEAGNLQNAYTSMASDMLKHEKTANHIGLELGMVMLLSGHLSTAKSMREFIEDFN